MVDNTSTNVQSVFVSLKFRFSIAVLTIYIKNESVTQNASWRLMYCGGNGDRKSFFFFFYPSCVPKYLPFS